MPSKTGFLVMMLLSTFDVYNKEVDTSQLIKFLSYKASFLVQKLNRIGQYLKIIRCVKD